MVELLHLGWLFSSLGFAIGLILKHSPTSESKIWGDQLIGYSLLTAFFLAVVGTGDVLNGLAKEVSEDVAGQAGMTWIEPDKLPEIYYTIAMNIYAVLGTITGIAIGTSIIPIVGPAISNVLSVILTLPGMAMTATLLLSFTLAAFLTVLKTFATATIMAAGIVLVAVPGGKLKGIGGWLIAMCLALSAIGPLIPAFGLMACTTGDQTCSLDELLNINFAGGTYEALIGFLFDVKNNVIMKAWRFVLGSMIGFTLLSVVAAALSRAIGGIASSLGIG